MPIHYILRPLSITPDPNDQTAIVIATDSVDEGEVFKRMAQGGSAFTESEMRGVTQLYRTTMTAMLLEGLRIRTQFGNYGVKIDGTLPDAASVFTSPANVLRIQINPSTEMSNPVQANAVLVKDVAAPPVPLIAVFKDVTTGNLNAAASSGGIGELFGENLKFDQTKTDEGIYFVNVSDNTEVKVASVSHNAAKRLSFLIPTLAAVQYRTEVRARFTPTGAVRTGDLQVGITGVGPAPITPP